jgi:glycosyltransferase involved in cell wall biosynthesis
MKYLKFSVVTVVLNREKFVRRAIESVLAQNYPNFEHIIIDGGSQDRTLEIVKEYPHLHWISEPDEGSVFALNKGIARMKGEIFAWLNSDETYLPGIFHKANEYFNLHLDWQMIYGRYEYMNRDGQVIGKSSYHPFNLHHQVIGFNPIVPSAMFLRHEALQGVGGFANETWKDAYDHELWIRVGKKYHIESLPIFFSRFGIHEDSGVIKTPEKSEFEVRMIRKTYGGEEKYIDRYFWVPYRDVRMGLFKRFKLERIKHSAKVVLDRPTG